VLTDSIFEYFVSCEVFVDSLPIFVLFDLSIFNLERVDHFGELILELFHHFVTIINGVATAAITKSTTAKAWGYSSSNAFFITFWISASIVPISIHFNPLRCSYAAHALVSEPAEMHPDSFIVPLVEVLCLLHNLSL